MQEHATFASGCFWCGEALFKRLKGVISVTSGYAGGDEKDPGYMPVAMGLTGHAESYDIVYDSSIISYEKLLEVFFTVHDPTSLNRQDYDMGTQYRSMILYHSDDQKSSAERFIRKLTENHVYKDPIVTEVVPFTSFYPAEKEHQNFYDTHKNVPYCTVIIDPKIRKLLEKFGTEIKEEYKTS